jgi:hypothetical protein
MSSLQRSPSASRLLSIDSLLLHSPSELSQRITDETGNTIPKTGAAHNAQSELLESLLKVSDKMDRFDAILEEKGHSFHGILESLFGMEPAMVKHIKILLKKMKKFNAEQVEHHEDMVEKLDEVNESLVAIVAIFMGTLSHIHHVQVQYQDALIERFDEAQGDRDCEGETLMETLEDINEVQTENQESLMMVLDYVQEEQRTQGEMLVQKLDHIHQVQVEQQEGLLERFYDIEEEQDNVGETLSKKLDSIHLVQHMQQDALMQTLEEVHEEQLESQNTIMEKLNEIQRHQSDTEASHSKWSVLMYGAQERTLDRLSALEENIEAMISPNAQVPEGSDADGKPRIKLQDGTPEELLQEDNTGKDVNAAGTNDSVTTQIERQATQGANSNSGQDRAGTLGALFNILGPLLLVALMLVGLPGGY